MHDDLRGRFAAALSKAHWLREATERLLAQTRETLHHARNTRNAATLTREVFKRRRQRAAASRLAASSLLRA